VTRLLEHSTDIADKNVCRKRLGFGDHHLADGHAQGLTGGDPWIGAVQSCHARILDPCLALSRAVAAWLTLLTGQRAVILDDHGVVSTMG
jgi:hypothetical protein